MTDHDDRVDSADEQLVHGLLRVASERGEAKERRISRLMDAIRDE